MATSLLDWIIDLMQDGTAREAFNDSPQSAMATAGFTNVCGSDVRPFLIDEPSIREVGGVDRFPEIAGASNEPQEIKYIVNNYTIESPSSSVSPAADDPDTNINVPGDGSTVNTTDEHSPTDNSVDTDQDSSTDNESEADNIVTGSDAAGEDQIRDSQLTDIGQGIEGDDNSNFLYLQDVVDTGDVHALSDLVNLDDVINESLNESPILNDLLEGGINDSLNNLVHDLL